MVKVAGGGPVSPGFHRPGELQARERGVKYSDIAHIGHRQLGLSCWELDMICEELLQCFIFAEIPADMSNSDDIAFCSD